MNSNKKKQQDYNLLHDEAVRTIVESKKWLEPMRNSPDHPILKHYSGTLPYESEIVDPNVLQIRKIVDRLRGNVKNITSGGCGWFAILLQEIVGGDIYHFNLFIKRNGKLVNFDNHELVLINGFCHDSEGVFRESTLKNVKKPLVKVDSVEELKVMVKKGIEESYYLIKVTKGNIINRYENGEYLSALFSENDTKALQRNATEILIELNKYSHI